MSATARGPIRAHDLPFEVPKIAFDRAGSGPRVLLIHGLGGERHVWSPVWETLTAEREVMRIDMPGFGRTRALKDVEPEPAVLARAIAAFLTEEGFDAPHVVGNSLGGWVALELARLGIARSVTGLCAAGFWRKTFGPRPRGMRNAVMLLRPLVPVAFAVPSVRRRALQNVVRHPERVPYRDAVRMASSYLKGPGFSDVADAMRARRIEDGDGIDVPVTLAWADHDQLVGHPRHTVFAPTRTAVLRDAGHVPMWDDPGRVARLILEDSA